MRIMAKIALINGGVVVNVTLADLVFAQTLPGYEMAIDITGTDVGVGWGMTDRRLWHRLRLPCPCPHR